MAFVILAAATKGKKGQQYKRLMKKSVEMGFVDFSLDGMELKKVTWRKLISWEMRSLFSRVKLS
ncbi:MAG: hypothetical protein QXN56_03325 [Candidatus Hadarchaeum sp.]